MYRIGLAVWLFCGAWSVGCLSVAWPQDCNLNGILDATDIANCSGDPACDDCNNNGIPDECDLEPRLSYGTAQNFTTGVTRPVCLVAADVNGQSGLDLVSGSLDSDVLEIWTNNGSGSFSAGGTVSVGDGPFEIVAAQLDGSTGIDLATVNLLDATASVSVAFNNGSGGFSSTSSISLGGTHTGITAGNFDGASGIDLAVVDRDNEEVTVLLNNGSGTFSVHTQPVAMITGDTPWRLTAFDLNENGRPDLAVANNVDNSISLFRNDFPSNNRFVAAGTLFPSGTGHFAIVAANVDSDDGDDLIVTADSSDDITVLLDNNSSSSFNTRGPFDAGSMPLSVVAGDLNNDNHVDLAAVNFNDGDVSVLLNNGSESFFNPFSSNPSVTSGPRYIVSGDFDGNGVLDLATANRDSSRISLLFGSLVAPVSQDCQFNGIPDSCELDCQNPPFAFCQNVTRSAQSGCQASVSPESVDASSFDPDGTTLGLSLSPSGPFGLGVTSVVLTIEDDCCQTDACSATITVVDDQSPSINCPSNRNVGTNSACNYNGSFGTATATDNCTSSGSISIANNAPSSLPLGANAVTWFATDQSGNTETCVQQVTVIDDDSPSLTCPSNTTRGTNLGCLFIGSIGSATVTDNCSSPGNVTITNNAPSTFSLGSTVVTWIAIDEANNSAICSQVVTIVDDDAPGITCPGDQTVQTNSGCGYVGSFGSVTATDNCSSPGDIAIANNAPALLPIGTTAVTWTATDEAGNSSSCTHDVTVVDGTPPIITCPSDRNVQTNSGCEFIGSIGQAAAFDNCSLAGQITIENDAPSAFQIGTTPVTWTATDAAGNENTCLQMVTVTDATPPQINCPASRTEEVNSGCFFVGGVGSATATDNCSSPGQIAIDNDAPGSFPLGMTTVTWTATDQAGNTSTCTQQVTVVDTTAPSINCQPAFSLPVNSGCTYVGTVGSASATDNCSLSANIAISSDRPTAFPLGDTLVTWTATDEAGNTDSCTQLLTIVDTIPPTISCPLAFTLPVNSGCLYTGALGVPTLADNCSASEDIVVFNDAPPSLPLGTNLVRWTAMDEAGNTTTCTQLLTVVDTDPPELTCPADVVRQTSSGCVYEGGIGTATVTDNCSDPGDVTVVNDAPDEFPLGSTTVTWTATDEAGNVDTCTQVVTVEDDDPPVISCPGPTTVGTNDGCGYSGGIGQATATDNCTSGGSIVITSDAPGRFPLGATTVTWTATDEAGNTTTCTQVVTVEDTVPPEITCPAATLVGTNTACGYVGDIGQATATDSCTSAGRIVIANDAPGLFPLGVTVVTWTATDEAGNVGTCTQVVTVEDAEPPTVTCSPDTTLGTNTACGYVGGIGNATAADGCAASSAILITNDAPAEFALGVTVVTWTATDEAGNMATCAQQVTITDAEPPSIVCPQAVTVESNSGCFYSGPFGDVTVDDACSSVGAITVTNDAPGELPPGTTTVIWTATDAAGNAANCIQEVTVVDARAPVVECEAEVTLGTTGGCVFSGEWATPLVGDNCSTPGAIALVHDAPADLPLGATTVTWTATDEAGNSAVCSQTVIVLDAQAPVLTCPGSQAMEAGADCRLATSELVPPGATDDCTGSSGIAMVHDAGDSLPLGTTRVTWTGTDEAGNSGSCQVDVTVSDTTPPLLDCPTDMTVETEDEDGVEVFFEAVATDSCSSLTAISYSVPPGSIFPLGETEVSCMGSDASGNSTSCTFRVTVRLPLEGGLVVPGDCNQDGSFDISDPVCVLGFLFLGRPGSLPCGDGGSADPSNRSLFAWGDGDIDLASAVRGLRFLFFGEAGHPLGADCVDLVGCPDTCGAGAQ